jgi:hypothetical protein
VGSDGVLVHEVCGGGDDGAAVFGVRCSPYTGYRVYIKLAGVAEIGNVSKRFVINHKMHGENVPG